eukprot:TRINITY_DN52619_c0_g1_i1.p2 TRINITY_DN52619_c0_g1~~TRINITY_DN52619_c0_g1_i1.p2  ORF type:complete len:138 (-),score=6.22 TRINITY_DN52619_c0_g1_i1:42-416(-)
MQANRLNLVPNFKSQLQGGPKFGCLISSGSVTIAERMSSKYDFTIIDVQHSSLRSEQIGCMFSTIRPMGVSLVRVNTPFDIQGVQEALDLGADGIIFPNIRNVQEAIYMIKQGLEEKTKRGKKR